jgi:hypothetical protein
MKRNQSVSIDRSQLATSLASYLPHFIFCNPGKVSKISANRIYVKWNKEDAFWFDAEAVKAVV